MYRGNALAYLFSHVCQALIYSLEGRVTLLDFIPRYIWGPDAMSHCTGHLICLEGFPQILPGEFSDSHFFKLEHWLSGETTS